MATNNYFPKKSESAPMIYAYEDKYDPNLKGILKVGYTTIGVQERVRQQYITSCAQANHHTESWSKNQPCDRMVLRFWTTMCIVL